MVMIIYVNRKLQQAYGLLQGEKLHKMGQNVRSKKVVVVGNFIGKW